MELWQTFLMNDKFDRYSNSDNNHDDIFKQRYEGNTIREKSEQFFSNINDLTAIKENLFRALTWPNQTNSLLVGPIASPKNLFIEAIKEQCKNVFYFDTTIYPNTKLAEDLYDNRESKVIIIEEIDKLKQNNIASLICLLNKQDIIRRQKPKKEYFKMENVKVFSTLNENSGTLSSKYLPIKVRSYFHQYRLPEYSEEDFISTIRLQLQDFLPIETIILLSKSLFAKNIKNTRIAIELSHLLKKEDTEDDTIRVIENWLKHQSDLDIKYIYNGYYV